MRLETFQISPPVKWGRERFWLCQPYFLLLLLVAVLVVHLVLVVLVPSCYHLRAAFPVPVFPAGPQPRSSAASVPCRTSTAILCCQCSLPDLNRDPLLPVFPCRTSTGRKNVRRDARTFARKNVRQIVREMSDRTTGDMRERMLDKFSGEMSETCSGCTSNTSAMIPLHIWVIASFSRIDELEESRCRNADKNAKQWYVS